MYYPSYLGIPIDVYRKSLDIAASYHSLLKRREEFQGKEEQTRINEWQIAAVENALQGARDKVEETFIAKNIFEGVQMMYIDLPMSISGMKRARKEFLIRLSANLNLL